MSEDSRHPADKRGKRGQRQKQNENDRSTASSDGDGKTSRSRVAKFLRHVTRLGDELLPGKGRARSRSRSRSRSSDMLSQDEPSVDEDQSYRARAKSDAAALEAAGKRGRRQRRRGRGNKGNDEGEVTLSPTSTGSPIGRRSASVTVFGLSTSSPSSTAAAARRQSVEEQGQRQVADRNHRSRGRNRSVPYLDFGAPTEDNLSAFPVTPEGRAVTPPWVDEEAPSDGDENQRDDLSSTATVSVRLSSNGSSQAQSSRASAASFDGVGTSSQEDLSSLATPTAPSAHPSHHAVRRRQDRRQRPRRPVSINTHLARQSSAFRFAHQGSSTALKLAHLHHGSLFSVPGATMPRRASSETVPTPSTEDSSRSSWPRGQRSMDAAAAQEAQAAGSPLASIPSTPTTPVSPFTAMLNKGEPGSPSTSNRSIRPRSVFSQGGGLKSRNLQRSLARGRRSRSLRLVSGSSDVDAANVSGGSFSRSSTNTDDTILHNGVSPREGMLQRLSQPALEELAKTPSGHEDAGTAPLDEVQLARIQYMEKPVAQFRHSWAGIVSLPETQLDEPQEPHRDFDAAQLVDLDDDRGVLFRIADLDMGPLLGQGFFGKVYKCTHKFTGEHLVMKELTNSDLSARAGFVKEIGLLKMLNHPNVLRFIGLFFHNETLRLITEYVDNGTLEDHILQVETPLPWDLRIQMAHDVAAGMAYLHSFRIIHRDLKTQNCLVRTNMSVVVCDFGLARVMKGELLRDQKDKRPRRQNGAGADLPAVAASTDKSGAVSRIAGRSSAPDESADVFDSPVNGQAGAASPGHKARLRAAHKGSRSPARGRDLRAKSQFGYGGSSDVGGKISRRARLMSVVGTPEWMAPELFMHKEYDESVDVFSFGVILCSLLLRRDPDPDEVRNHMFGLDDKKLRKLLPADCPEELLEMTLHCAALSPSDRPTFDDVAAKLFVLGLVSSVPVLDRVVLVTSVAPQDQHDGCEPVRTPCKAKEAIL